MLANRSKQLLQAQFKRMTARAATTNLVAKMQLMTVSRKVVRSAVMPAAQHRMFSGSLPDHIELEMPNLSPTMEKVRLRQPLILASG